MRIVVIGAGVGGLASAVGLAGAGHDVQVYEQAPELRVGGNGMIVWPSGASILGEFGIPYDEIGQPMNVTNTRIFMGFTVARIDWSKVGKQYGAPPILARRGKLIERLAQQLPEGVLKLGLGCSGFENRTSGGTESVKVTLTDGSTVEADVLIGADGHRSSVRRELFGDSTAGYTGWAAWHGVTIVPPDLNPPNEVNVYMGEAGLVALHPLGDDLLYWAFETPWQDGELLPPGAVGPDGVASRSESAAANLRDRFAAYASPIPELLDMIKDNDINLFPFVRHRVLRQWGRGRVTLAGDAAHVVPPRMGQGANQALEDAWMLRRVLANATDASKALRRYERTRRATVRRISMTARFVDSKLGPKIMKLLYGRKGPVDREAEHKEITRYSNYFVERDRPAPANV
jgi:FAD-dependent urate hydroxylase